MAGSRTLGDNLASRTAFIKGGYQEVLTYKDSARGRDTTVLRATIAEGAASGSPRKKRRQAPEQQAAQLAALEEPRQKAEQEADLAALE